jgi:hypothetical protein
VTFNVDKVALGWALLRVVKFAPVYFIPPILLSSPLPTRCSYRKDKRAKPGNLPKSNAFSEIWEPWKEKNLFVFNEIT